MNKKMLISIALLFLMILNCVSPVIVFAGDNAATSGDVEITLNSNLYEAVKSTLMEQEIIASYNDAQRTISIAQTEIDRVTTLNISNFEIDDLDGLEIFKNVTKVDLSANKLTKDSSLEVLSGMPLEYLDLSSNEIEDISGISNFDTIAETNLHNQKFTAVEILTLTDPELGDEADEVIAKYTAQLPQILSQAGTFKSEWLIEEITTLYGEPLRVNWSVFDPTTLDVTFVTGSEYGPYEGMIKFKIRITDATNNLYNTEIDLFYVTVTGEQRGIIFKDRNLYEAVKAQLEQGQRINQDIRVYTNEETLYDAAYDEPMVLVIPINTIINKITSLKLDNYQIEDLTGIEKFVGLKEELDISFNYIDTLEKVFALVDEKLIEEDILQTKFTKKVKGAADVAKKLKTQFETIREAEAEMEANAESAASNQTKITKLEEELATLESTTTDAETKIAEKEATIAKNNETIETNNETITTNKETIETLEESIEDAEAEIDEIKEEITAQNKIISDAELAKAGTTDETLITQYETIITEANTKITAYNEEITALEEEIAGYETSITTAEANITTAETNNKDLEAANKTLNEEITELKKDSELVAKETRISEIKKEIETLSKETEKLLDTEALEEKIAKAQESIDGLRYTFLEELKEAYNVYSGYYTLSSILTTEVEDLEYNDEYNERSIDDKRSIYKAQMDKLVKMYPNFNEYEKAIIKDALGIPDEVYDEDGEKVEDPILYTLQEMAKNDEVTGGTIKATFAALEGANEAIKAMNYCLNKRYVTGTTTCYLSEYFTLHRNEMLELSFALMGIDEEYEYNDSYYTNEYGEAHDNLNGYTALESIKYNYLTNLINDYITDAGFTCSGEVDDTDDVILETLVNSILKVSNASSEEFERGVSIADLEKLDAECNLIQDIEGLEKLNTIIELIFRDNEIVDINCVDWSQFTKLEVLDLARNAISEIDALNNLTRIEILDLDSNLIEGRVELNISSFKYLQEVDFSENKITDIENLMTQYIFIARDKGYDSVSDFLTARYTVKIYFHKQILKMDIELAEDDSVVYVDLPLIFRQIEELDPKPTTFGLYSAIGNVTNDGKRVMLDVTSAGNNTAYVQITSSDRYGRSLGDETMCYINYVVTSNDEEVENTVENTVENVVENTVENVVDNTINNTVNNTVDNTVENTVENTVDNTVNNTVDNTVNNTVDNTVDNTVNNTVDNTINNQTTTLGYETKGDEIVGVSPDTDADTFAEKLTDDYTVVIKTEDGETVTDGNVATGMLVVLYDEDNTAVAVYELVVKGDVNGDGTADAIDSRLIKAHRAEVKLLEDVYESAADIDGDGKVTAIDSRLLLYHRAEVEGYIL